MASAGSERLATEGSKLGEAYGVTHTGMAMKTDFEIQGGNRERSLH